MCSSVKCFVVSILVGIVAIILGAVLGFKVLPDFVDSEIASNVQLQLSDQYMRWEKLPFPLVFKVYIFTVENAPEVMAGKGVIPKLKERGPYVYTQTMKKFNIEYNEKNETYTYEQSASFEFDAKMSAPLKEEDEVTIFNAPKWGVLEIMSLSWITAQAWSENIFPDSVKTMFHTVPVNKLLFDGYTFCPEKGAPLACKVIREQAKGIKNMVVTEEHVSFSFFDYKNNKPDGIYTVTSGFSDASKTGQISSFEGSNYVDFWDGGESVCNEVRGTDSYIFAPYNTKETVLDVFSSDVCRTVSLDYLEKTDYKGIPGYRSVMRENTLHSPSSNPENECFCINKTHTIEGKKTCQPDGLLDLYTCINTQVLASFPHFLWGDPELSEKLGLKPDPEKHRTYIDLEPYTGSPMRGAKRLQFNMVMRELPNLKKITGMLPRLVMPILWVEESVHIPPHLVDMLNEKLLSKLPIVEGLKWGLIGGGAAIIVIGLIVYCVGRKKTSAHSSPRNLPQPEVAPEKNSPQTVTWQTEASSSRNLRKRDLRKRDLTPRVSSNSSSSKDSSAHSSLAKPDEPVTDSAQLNSPPSYSSMPQHAAPHDVPLTEALTVDSSQGDSPQRDSPLLVSSQNDTSQNDTSKNDTSQNATSHNYTSHNDTSQNDTSQNDTSQNDTSPVDSPPEHLADW